MSILRHHHDTSYTVIPNDILNDKRLSLKDIGLLCFILHLPDGWNFSVNGLASILPHDGRDSISSGLKRIEQAGYLKRDRERDSVGRLAEAVWIVSDTPMTENPAQENTIQINKEIKKVRSKGFPSENIHTIKGFPSESVHDTPDCFVEAVKEEYESVKQKTPFPYSVDEVLTVFRTFFDEYARRTGNQHPYLSRSQIRFVMQRMPYFGNGMDRSEDIDPDTYPDLIDAYFDVDFRNCDYNITHFMSGAIRKNRYRETN